MGSEGARLVGDAPPVGPWELVGGELDRFLTWRVLFDRWNTVLLASVEVVTETNVRRELTPWDWTLDPARAEEATIAAEATIAPISLGLISVFTVSLTSHGMINHLPRSLSERHLHPRHVPRQHRPNQATVDNYTIVSKGRTVTLFIELFSRAYAQQRSHRE
jgi:hypothetical protein